MILDSKIILAVGAHPDDIELGCGGTLCQASKHGVKVVALYMTHGEQSGKKEQRAKESENALSVLGVKDAFFGDFPDTDIPSCHKALDFLEQFYIKYKPDVVITHTVNDTHQDHRQVGWLSISAFRNAHKILAYETPRVSPAFSPNFFVDVTDCIDAKWNALKCHLTQTSKRYLTYESMVNLASFRGSQVNIRAAEAFEVVKYVEIC